MALYKYVHLFIYLKKSTTGNTSETTNKKLTKLHNTE